MITLRGYQEEALEGLRREMRAGHKRIILQALTGLGKTIMASAMIAGALKRRMVTLFVAHRRELITQASDKLSAFGIRHGIIMPGEDPGNLELVYVGTVQSFTARMRRKVFEPGDVQLIVFDEAHRSSAASYQAMLDAFPQARVIGLTATPTRGDEKGLGDTYTAMVQTMTYEEAFERGYLVRPKYYAPFTPDLENVRTRAGDYVEADLEAEMNKPALTGDIVSHYARHARLPDGSLRQGVVFAVNVRHSMALAQAFNAAGIPAAHLDGETKTAERDVVTAAYRRKEYTVMVNVGLFGEGWDVPECSAVVLACPTKSVIKHLQTAGRGLRPHPESGKDSCLILDHAGNVLRLGMVEEYKDWTLEKGSEYSPNQRKKEKKDLKEITCDSCGHLFYSAKVCPSCGHEHEVERSPKAVEVAEGDLVELGASERKKYTQEEKKRWWAMMLYLTHMEGRKPGYAYFAYKVKFGCGPGPWQKKLQPTPADEEVAGWWHHYKTAQRDRWKKEREQREALISGHAAD